MGMTFRKAYYASNQIERKTKGQKKKKVKSHLKNRNCTTAIDNSPHYTKRHKIDQKVPLKFTN